MRPKEHRQPVMAVVVVAAVLLAYAWLATRPRLRDDCVAPERDLEEIYVSTAPHLDIDSVQWRGSDRETYSNDGTLYDEACEVLTLGFDNEGSNRPLPWWIAVAKMPSAAAATERFKSPPGELTNFQLSEPGRYLDRQPVAGNEASWTAHYLHDCLLVSARWGPEEVTGTDGDDRDRIIRGLLSELPDFCGDVS